MTTTYDAWFNNPPDYYISRQHAENFAQLKKEIRLLKRQIEKIDEETLEVSGKPRSNETRIARNKATSQLKDRLAELEAEHDAIEVMIAFTNTQKTMAQIASYLNNGVNKVMVER